MNLHVDAQAVWNAFPSHLRSPSISRGQFRAGLKIHLFTQAYGHLWEFLLKSVFFYITFTYALVPLLPPWAPAAPAPRVPPSRHNVPVVSHAQYVLTVTAAPASRVKAAVSKAAWWPWPLTLKVVVSESRVTLPLPILVFVGLSVLDLGPMYATDRRQTKASLNAPAY